MNSREDVNELGIDHRISADHSARKYRIRGIVFGVFARAYAVCVLYTYSQTGKSLLCNIEQGKARTSIWPLINSSYVACDRYGTVEI